VITRPCEYDALIGLCFQSTQSNFDFIYLKALEKLNLAEASLAQQQKDSMARVIDTSREFDEILDTKIVKCELGTLINSI
jgi:hypothetical protein